MLWVWHQWIRGSFKVVGKAKTCGEEGKQGKQERGDFEEETDGKELR